MPAETTACPTVALRVICRPPPGPVNTGNFLGVSYLIKAPRLLRAAGGHGMEKWASVEGAVLPAVITAPARYRPCPSVIHTLTQQGPPPYHGTVAMGTAGVT
ncbi:hypothetical protein Bbelb_323920 [Branchiostoma belcheri]|nr:hypothetical protein Bbelb_323920 [Branchiostoma belcheri]